MKKYSVYYVQNPIYIRMSVQHRTQCSSPIKTKFDMPSDAHNVYTDWTNSSIADEVSDFSISHLYILHRNQNGFLFLIYFKPSLLIAHSSFVCLLLLGSEER